MTIIEQIKTEIEKLIERYGSVEAKGVLQEGYKGGRLIGYEDALEKIGATIGDKVRVIIVKEDEK